VDGVVRNDRSGRENAAARATGAFLRSPILRDVVREDIQRRIVVTANVAGRDLRGTALEVPSAVKHTVSLPAGYDFIILFGIAIRNGIMLLTHYRHLIGQEGLDPAKAVMEGSVHRLTPVLMTALTAALALVPIVLAAGQPGNEIQAPMAAVILGGLVSSTILNLLVIPPLFAWFGSATRGGNHAA
jgi:Cu/Ag efflux pump CusA